MTACSMTRLQCSAAAVTVGACCTAAQEQATLDLMMRFPVLTSSFAKAEAGAESFIESMQRGDAGPDAGADSVSQRRKWQRRTAEAAHHHDACDGETVLWSPKTRG